MEHVKTFKSITPGIWFLDDDLSLSARYLTNKHLSKNIENIIRVLINVRYYYFGIRSNRHFDYYFDNSRKQETIEKLFGYDITTTIKYNFSFTFYTHKISKWARKCQENYLYLLDYLDKCLIEWEFRTKKSHKLIGISEILLDDKIFINKLPKGNIKKIQLEWKVIPLKYRTKDIITGFRKFYSSKIEDCIVEYKDSNRDIPEFIISKRNIV